MIANSGTICDFKTGDRLPHHYEQLLFYSVLVWLAEGVAATSLKNIYTASGEETVYEGVSEAGLAAKAEELRREIAEITDVLESGKTEAKPAKASCQYCPVRQMCDEYWSSNEVAEFRATPVLMGESEGDGPFWLDAEITNIPPAGSGACVGRVEADGGTPVLITLPERWTSVRPATSVAARLLRARLQRRGDAWECSATDGTEVFWLSNS